MVLHSKAAETYARAFEQYVEVSFPRSFLKITRAFVMFPLFWRHYWRYLKLTCSSFWASFGWLDLYLRPLWYRVLFGVDLFVLAGLGFYATQVARKKVRLETWQKYGIVTLALSVFFVFMQMWLRDTVLFSAYPHARLLFVAIIPISFFFVLGMRQWLQIFLLIRLIPVVFLLLHQA